MALTMAVELIVKRKGRKKKSLDRRNYLLLDGYGMELVKSGMQDIAEE